MKPHSQHLPAVTDLERLEARAVPATAHPTSPWSAGVRTEQELRAQLEIRYPPAGVRVDGLIVAERIPNLSSIPASFGDWSELPGIRTLPFSDFGGIESVFYARDDMDRARELARKIQSSGWVAPLIIVIDRDGPYILEGAHRFVALHFLNKTHFPALVVLDTESLFLDPPSPKPLLHTRRF